MAKRWGSPKQIAALKKMQRARRASLRGKRKGGRARTGTTRVKMRRTRARRRNPLQALVANPSWVPAIYGADSAARRRRKTKRRPAARRAASTRKRTMPKRRRRRKTVARRRPRVRARGRRRRVVGYAIGNAPIRRRRMNPRRRRRSAARRRVGRRRRRNPGMRGGLVMRTLLPFASGFATSMAAAVLDAGMASYPKLRNVVKVAGAVAIAFFGRRHPVPAAAAIGALAGSAGYSLGTKLAGGMIARTPEEAVQGLGAMADSYPEMGALLTGGVGALLTGTPDVPNVVGNYQVALDNMADDDDY